MKVYSASSATHSSAKLIVFCALSAAIAAGLAVLIVTKTQTGEDSGGRKKVATPSEQSQSQPTNSTKEPPGTPIQPPQPKAQDLPPVVTPPEPVSLQMIPPDFETKLGQRLKLRGATVSTGPGPLIRYELKSSSGISENWFVEDKKQFSLYCTLPSAPTPELLEAARHLWKESIDTVLTTKDILAGQACLDEAFGKAAPAQEIHSSWRYGGMFEVQATVSAPDAPNHPATAPTWSFSIGTRSPPRH